MVLPRGGCAPGVIALDGGTWMGKYSTLHCEGRVSEQCAEQWWCVSGRALGRISSSRPRGLHRSCRQGMAGRGSPVRALRDLVDVIGNAWHGV